MAVYYAIDGSNIRILGSIHMFPVETPEIPQWIVDACAWSERLVLEHDVSNPLPFLLASKPEVNASAVLPESMLDRIRLLWPAGAPVRPDELTALAVPLLWAGLTFERAPGVERMLTVEYARRGVDIAYLEDVGTLRANAEDVPLAAVVQALELWVQDHKQADEKFHRLHAAWLSDDVERFAAVGLDSPLMHMTEVREALLDKRNRAWAEAIAPVIATPYRTLIAVGAMHLVGNESLLVQLQRAGLTVRPLA